jgi:hypothetical protein
MINWEIGDDLGLQLQCKDDVMKDTQTLSKMFREINKVISLYGYKINQMGNWETFRKSVHDEYEFIKNLEIVK